MSNPLMQFANERRWVNWRLVDKGDGKPTKLPYQPSGVLASTTDPNTWHTLTELHDKGFNGRGLVFTPDQLLLGVDGDHILAGDQISDDCFKRFVGAADTYTEVSPSKTGLHIYLALTQPLDLERNRKNSYEAYTVARYFTVTFQPFIDKPIRTVTPVEAIELLKLLGYPWRKQENIDLLERMFQSRNGGKIRALYDGDTSEYSNDQSAADLALCCHLSWWANGNAAEIERLWLESPLGAREKTQQRKDYRDRTISAALSQVRGGFTSNTGTNETSAPAEAKPKTDKKAPPPTDDDLADLWAAKHPDVVYGLGEFRHYADGFYEVVKRDLVKSEILDVCKAAKVCGARPSARLIASVTELASLQLLISDERWDTDPDILVCNNGTLHIPSMTLREHRAEDFQSSAVCFDFDPQARAPMFEYALNCAIPDAADFLQEFVGYSFTTDTQYETALWFTGPMGSGKSTITSGIQVSMGARAGLLSLADVERSSFALTNLPGKTLVVSTEQPTGYMQHSHVLNAIISGEPISVDRKFRDPVILIPHAKILWAMNELPRIGDAGNGLFRRVKVIKFPPLQGPPDPRIKEAIKGEGAGVLNWALEGLARLRARGHFDIPACVRSATDDFQQTNDVPAVFVSECCEVGPNLKASASLLYNEYKDWCIANGHKPQSSTSLAAEWERLGFDKKHTMTGAVYEGVGLRAVERRGSE
jgi:putative DNA primase/helicase